MSTRSLPTAATSTAYGIRVTGNGTVTPAAGDVVTINNSGDIIVRVSQDGGTTFQRGDAIDVSEAPNRTVINLMGNGTAAANIYGNIELQSDADTINVTDGETRFNGDRQLATCCGPFVGSLHLDVAAQNDCGVGTLNINTGGNLHLLNVAADGPSYVFMNTLNMGAAGTITFDLPPCRRNGADRHLSAGVRGYGQPRRNDRRQHRGTGVTGCGTSTIYENVIDAVTRNGHVRQLHHQRHPDGIAAAERHLHLRQPGERRHRRRPGAVRVTCVVSTRMAPRSRPVSTATSMST